MARIVKLMTVLPKNVIVPEVSVLQNPVLQMLEIYSKTINNGIMC
jgi:hypothetical protein